MFTGCDGRYLIYTTVAFHVDERPFGYEKLGFVLRVVAAGFVAVIRHVRWSARGYRCM